MLLTDLSYSCYFNFIPQDGQNIDPLVGLPQRGHLFSDKGLPQVGQNAAPGAIGELQPGHRSMFDEFSGAPQVTHLEAFVSLSAPHLGHGLYGSPQNGQNLLSDLNFLLHLEQ